METTIKLHSYSLRSTRTYLFAALFVAGNIALPQLCHLMPQGGLIFLPIYFFTLVGAYKYGLGVGLLTAVFSPLLNHALFAMPAAAMLPSILVKSVILALVAGYAAHRFGERTGIAVLACVVAAYQLLGCAAEMCMGADFMLAVQDFRMGIPGMLLQVLGGYAVIKYLLRN